jgi:hypothetical protein
VPGAFYGTAVISGMSNVLMLTGAMFMLEIYDRVLPSRSMPTLVGLLVLVAVLFTALGVLDAIRWPNPCPDRRRTRRDPQRPRLRHAHTNAIAHRRPE